MALKIKPVPKLDEELAAEEAAEAARDYVMARLGAAVAALDAAKFECMEALTHFITPSDDRRATKRKDAIDAALESAGIASRALEAAADREVWAEIDPQMDEPWEEDDADEESAS